MARLLTAAALAATLLPAACGLLSTKPTSEQLARCLAQGSAGPVHLLGGYSLGQLIEAAEAKRFGIGWRRTGELTYTLALIGKAGVTPQAGRLAIDLAEMALHQTASCTQPSLVIQQATIDGQVAPPIAADHALMSMIEDYVGRQPASENEPAAAIGAPEQPQPLAPVTAGKLDQVLNLRMLGVTIDYLERFTGPPAQSYGRVRTYKVEGCEVVALVGDNIVTALGMTAISGGCSFDMRSFVPSLPGSPTYEQLSGGLDDGAWRATCLIQCGDARNPLTFFQGRTGKVVPSLEVVAFGLGTPQLWYGALAERYGEAWIKEGKFNCQGVDNLPGVPLLSWGAQHPQRFQPCSTRSVGEPAARDRCRPH